MKENTSSLNTSKIESVKENEFAFNENLFSDIIDSSTMEKAQSVLDHIENLQNQIDSEAKLLSLKNYEILKNIVKNENC